MLACSKLGSFNRAGGKGWSGRLLLLVILLLLLIKLVLVLIDFLLLLLCIGEYVKHEVVLKSMFPCKCDSVGAVLAGDLALAESARNPFVLGKSVPARANRIFKRA